MSEPASKNIEDSLAEVVAGVFASLAGLKLTVKTIESTDTPAPPYDVSGIIGLTGSKRGSLVVSLPRAFAAKLTEVLVGPPEDPDDADAIEDELCDCMSEVANVIGGNLLPTLTEAGKQAPRLSLPSTVLGNDHVIWRREDMPYHRAEFESEFGPVSVALSLRGD